MQQERNKIIKVEQFCDVMIFNQEGKVPISNVHTTQIHVC